MNVFIYSEKTGFNSELFAPARKPSYDMWHCLSSPRAIVYSEKTDSVRECSRLLGSRATRGVSRSTKRAWFQLWQRLPRVRLRWSNRTSCLHHAASQIVSHRPPRQQLCCSCLVSKHWLCIRSQAMFLFLLFVVKIPKPSLLLLPSQLPQDWVLLIDFLQVTY